MSDWLQISFDSSPPWWLWLLVPALVALVLWTYRRTWPPLRPAYRLLLIALRLAVVLFAACLLFEPVLTVTRSTAGRERVAVLVDRSASMLLPLSGDPGTEPESRIARAVALLGPVREDSLVVVFGFGGPVDRVVDTRELLDSPADRTDLTAALDKLGQPDAGRWDRVYLLTDGAINSGGDPLRYAGALPPVESVVLGENPVRPDLALIQVRQSRPAFAGESVELEFSAAVDAPGGGTGQAVARSLVVDFLDNGRKIKEALLTATSAGGRFLGAKAELPGLSEGRHVISAVLRELPGEWTALNNERLLIVDVSRARQRMLLVTNSVDWDFTFLRRALARQENWAVSSLVLLGGEKGGVMRLEDPEGAFSQGHLPTAQELDELELVALHGNLAGFDRGFLDRLALRAARGGFALVFWPVSPLDIRALSAGLARCLPFGPSGAVLTPAPAPDLPCRLRVDGPDGIIDGLGGGPESLSLPPVERAFSAPGLAPGAQTLVSVSGSSSGRPDDLRGAPLLVAGSRSGARCATVLGSGLWHWHMLGRESSPGGDSVYERLWEMLGDWLIAGRRSTSGLDLHPGRAVFSLGQTVLFEGSAGGAADDSGSGLKVRLSVVRSDSSTTDTVVIKETVPLADGKLSVSLGSLDPGVYRYRADTGAGNSAPASEGSFAVEPYSPEMAQVNPDTTLPAALSRATGSGMLTQDMLAARLESGLTIRRISRRIRLSADPWLYLGLIGLLAAEWALRRRKSLA